MSSTMPATISGAAPGGAFRKMWAFVIPPTLRVFAAKPLRCVCSRSTADSTIEFGNPYSRQLSLNFLTIRSNTFWLRGAASAPHGNLTLFRTCSTVLGDTPTCCGMKASCRKYTRYTWCSMYGWAIMVSAIRGSSPNRPVKSHVQARTILTGYFLLPAANAGGNQSGISTCGYKDAIDAVPAKGYSTFGATFTVCFG